MVGGDTGLCHLHYATGDRKDGSRVHVTLHQRIPRAGGKINSCRRRKKQVRFECICCPLFLKALQTLAPQSASITGAFPADYMQWSRVHIQHGLYMLALTTGARSKQSFSERNAKNFSHHNRESQAVSPGKSGQELWFLMCTVSGASPSPAWSKGSVSVGEEKGKWEGNVKAASAIGPAYFQLTTTTTPEDLAT